jgi:hypothetical protein
MTIARFALFSYILAAAASGIACGGTEDAATAPASAARGADTAAPPADTTDDIELNADMLNAFERGLRAEIAAVRAAQKRSSEAKTPQERGEAIQASFETATVPIGAAAAGLGVDRYRALRETVDEVFRTLDIQGKIDGPISYDLSRADEATKQRLSRDPFADLPPASADALRAHMDRLVPVWLDYVKLTAVAG